MRRVSKNLANKPIKRNFRAGKGTFTEGAITEATHEVAMTSILSPAATSVPFSHSNWISMGSQWLIVALFQNDLNGCRLLSLIT